MWPRAESAFLFGNTDIWMAAGIAAGLRWGWPALLLVVKPMLPAARRPRREPPVVVGRRPASWSWSSLAMLPLWSQYITAMRTLRIGLDYSLGSLPLLLVPIMAWLGRGRATRDPGPSARGSGGTGDAIGRRATRAR